MDIERKKKGKNFFYVKKNKIIDNPKILDRIKKLVIPPAWINVVIANNPNDKVQCTGYDDKGRKQYKYNTEFSILKTPDYTDNPLKSNYSISLDIYLNPQDSNVSDAYNRDAVIFDFCKRPIVMYNNLSRELIFKMINKKGNLEIIHKTKNFMYQKWNSIVINLYDNKVDIFINKRLINSINNIPIYFKDANNNIINDIIVGENNGIHGSIRNIYYYKTIRNQNNLEFLFNRLKPEHDLIKLDDIKLPISKITE